MSQIKTLQDLFQRYRRPGDMFFAMFSLALSLFLLWQLPYETTWVKRTKLFAQPAFWPAIAIGFMTLFSSLHLLGALVSARIPGRWTEVLYWLRSIEFAVWLMAYVFAAPILGYLPSTILFCVTLSYRMGYRTSRGLLASAGFAVIVVVVFKTFLQVKLPAGMIYEYLPDGLRGFMLTYL